MHFDVVPEPSEPEREALAVALERLLADEGEPAVPAAYRSRWRAAGLAESVAPYPSGPSAAGRAAGVAAVPRRRRPGATRA